MVLYITVSQNINIYLTDLTTLQGMDKCLARVSVFQPIMGFIKTVPGRMPQKYNQMNQINFKMLSNE
jgi:hypothetical protein